MKALPVIILISLLLLLCCCSDSRPDGRLARIAATVSETPEEALAALGSISRDSLSESDRHLHDLLTIKARDKAYIHHTSDSLILDVIDYESKHKGDGHLAEALYYGGRVYSDLGDYPTALQYFHNALDNLQEGKPDIDLKAAIISQTGRLLGQLGLYDEAIPYIKESISIGEEQKDTVNMVYDIQLLGNTYLRAYKYDLAEHYFHKAIELSCNLPESFDAISRMHLAQIKYETDKLDSALILIRDVPKSVRAFSRNDALANASTIYLDNGVLDTAYIYARELLYSAYPNNKGTAYETLLSPLLRNYVPVDSVYKYVPDYIDLLVRKYDDNVIKMSAIQQGAYNYDRHVIEKQAAENKNTRLKMWILALASVCLALITVVLYYKNRNKMDLLRLHDALDNIQQLKLRLETRHYSVNKDVDSPMDDRKEPQQYPISVKSLSEDDMREKLRRELLLMYENNKDYIIPTAIVQSDAYRMLYQHISENRLIDEDSKLWGLLENVILDCSPSFRTNLLLLTNGRLSLQDLRMAYLIKCGVSPSQMISLLGRTKGTISYRRESICFKVFDKKLGSKVIDSIIQSL